MSAFTQNAIRRVATLQVPRTLAATAPRAAFSTSIHYQKTVTETAKDALKTVNRVVGEKLAGGIDSAAKATDTVKAATKDVAGSTANSGAASKLAGEVKGKANEYAGEAKGAASQVAGETKGKTYEKSGRVENTSSKLAQDVKSKVNEYSNETSGTASEAVGKAKGAASELAGEAKGKASELTGKAKGAAEEAQRKL